MNRGYEHIPNRIIAPHTSVILDPPRRNEYELPRAGRKTLLGSPPTTTRQPLLGDAPSDRSSYYRSSNSYSSVPYNGPVIEMNRRRGFDKGPGGEDLIQRTSTRQPLLRTPKLAVERIGGDMDISRSRSASPEFRLINARSVRDERKKDRGGSRRSRSRSRSRRSRSRSSRRSRSRSNPREIVRERGNPRDRTTTRATYAPPSGAVREGVVWTNENYHDFLHIFIDLLNSEIGKDMDVHEVLKMKEHITPASDAEKHRIVLPPELHDSRERMLHCDTSIVGLPASIFYGSGYGTRQHCAKYSAAKDFIDKCLRIGVIKSDLHAAISNRHRIDKSFQQHHIGSISKAVSAVILLIKKMSREILPAGFMTLRDLEPDTIDKFKHMLRMVMIDIYYQGNEHAVASVPEALESSHSRSSRGSQRSESPYDHREQGRQRDAVQSYNPGYYEQNSKDRQVDLEREVEKRVKQELEKKRHEMEQELRQKCLEDARAKVRAEFEMEKRIEHMMQEQQKFNIEKERERREQEEQQKKQAMTQKVEDDFYDLVSKLEQQFVNVRERGLNNVLDMIFASSTFKTIQVYSTTLTSMNFEQKQNLVIDLRELLGNIAEAVQESTPVMRAVPSPVQLPTLPYETPTSSRHDQATSLIVGDMRLRLLTPSEQRRLSKGSKVIAQDVKTGNWNLAVVMKVADERVTVAVGSAQWKKQWHELYIEDNGSSRY